jgi:hypothetical protein
MSALSTDSKYALEASIQRLTIVRALTQRQFQIQLASMHLTLWVLGSAASHVMSGTPRNALRYLPLYGRYPARGIRYMLCRAEVLYVQCCTVRAEGARWSSPPCPRPSPAAPPPRPIVHDLPQNGVESIRPATRHREMGVGRSTTAVSTGIEHNRCATISLGAATGKNVRGLVKYAATKEYSV